MMSVLQIAVFSEGSSLSPVPKSEICLHMYACYTNCFQYVMDLSKAKEFLGLRLQSQLGGT